jgi:plastocyanin
MKRSVRLTRLAAVAALGLVLGCGSSTSTGAAPGPNQVFLQNIAFNPSTRTVSAGTTVQWVNQDGVTHTVTYDSGPGTAFDSGNLAGGADFSVTFATPGTIQYHCTIHGSPGAGMHGTIVVQ